MQKNGEKRNMGCEQPAISIIIPIYNTEKYIIRCVQSLQQQTIQNIEICLIDDGSTDGSGAICDALAAEDTRIRVLHKKNEGQGITRNKGIEIASGEFIAFLDSDDYWDSDGCRRILQCLQRTGADVCSFGYCKENERGSVQAVPAVSEAVYNGELVQKVFALHFFGDDPSEDNLRGVSACMSCFRRSIVMEHRVRFASEREVLSEDTIFCLEFCRYCGKAAVISDTIYHYVMRNSSHTHSADDRRLQRTLEFTDVLKTYASDYGILDCKSLQIRLQNTVWITILEMIRSYARMRNGQSGIKAFLMLPEVQENAAEMSGRSIGWKQKLLCTAIRWHFSGMVYLMGKCG